MKTFYFAVVAIDFAQGVNGLCGRLMTAGAAAQWLVYAFFYDDSKSFTLSAIFGGDQVSEEKELE